MKIGQLLKFIPQYPTMGGNSPLDSECIVMLIDKDFVGFRSEVLISEQKFWVRNTDLYELTDEDREEELSFEDNCDYGFDEAAEEDWFNSYLECFIELRAEDEV